MWGPPEGLAVLALRLHHDDTDILPKNETGHDRAKPRPTNRPARVAGLVARLIAVMRAN
jgi:hypothetical protein